MTDPLPPLRNRLLDEARRLKLPIEVIERDYALGHVLGGIFGVPELRGSLVFKGGTALKKAYFGDYRFSVDLDFSAAGGPRGEDLSSSIEQAVALAGESLSDYGQFDLRAQRRPNRTPHPGRQEAFKVLVQFPWRGNVPCSIKLEITVDEPVLLAVEARPLIHGYGEQLVANLTCYSLEEIVAEKLRTLLQARKRLEERRWTRNCARDYYDLWWLGTNPEFVVEWPAAIGVLAGKCAIRDVAYSSSDDFFVDDIVAEARRQWESSLRDLVGQLPSFDMMIATLRSRIDALM